MPDSIAALAVALLFVVPGYLSMLVLAKWSGFRRPTDHHAIMTAIAFGLVDALLGLLVLSSSTGGKAIVACSIQGKWAEALCREYNGHPGTVTLWLLGYAFVLPVITGWAVVNIRNLGWFERLMNRTTSDRVNEDTWDYLFDRENSVWVHVHLDDGQTVYEGMTEHVGMSQSNRALLLGRFSVDEERTPIKRRVALHWQEIEADQVYIDSAQIRVIEVFKP